jgi:hypothetical protein
MRRMKKRIIIASVVLATLILATAAQYWILPRDVWLHVSAKTY